MKPFQSEVFRIKKKNHFFFVGSTHQSSDRQQINLKKKPKDYYY